MSTAKSTTTKPSSASARAQRHANRSTSAPPSETHAPTAPQAHASLPVIQEGSVTADAGIQPARSACEHSVIDIDAADAPTTTAAVATTTAAATQIVHEHSVIDTDTTEDPTVAPAHPERTHSVIDVDGNEPPAQEKGRYGTNLCYRYLCGSQYRTRALRRYRPTSRADGQLPTPPHPRCRDPVAAG
ncbi:hypothetical protein B0H19DRAFT_1064289 [Mycena capillaripes]|nr:hypothetical protein B0H19DRAFT_1064289 [Mycena capillaripes]